MKSREELKQEFLDKEMAIVVTKRAGKENVTVVGRTSNPMMDLALIAEAFEKLLCENANKFRSKREARLILCELMEEICDEAFDEVAYE